MTASGPPARAIARPDAMSALRRSPWRNVVRVVAGAPFFMNFQRNFIVCDEKCGQHPLTAGSVCHGVYFAATSRPNTRCSMADGFVWYELVTNDMEKAVAFYSKVVGWDVRDSGMPGMQYMLFGKDGKDVGGMMTWAGAGAPEMPPEWMGHIHTAKLDEELEAVTADGGTIVKPAQDIPGVGRFAVVLDPQKVKHLLFEPGSE